MTAPAEPPVLGPAIPGRHRAPLRAALLRCGPALVALAAWIPLALLSQGVHHDDELTHYLIARWAWSDPRGLIDIWGRPGLTWLLAPVAPLGWTACRLLMGAASVACVALVADIARRLELRHAALAPWLLLVQPLFFVGGFTTLTETAAALYLTAAAALFVRGRLVASAAALSLVAVTRYEAVTLLVAWGTALAVRRARPAAFLALAWAPLAHNLAGLLVDGSPAWAVMLAPQPTDHYGAGGPLSMLARALLALGPAAALVAGAGTLAARALWRPSTWVIPAAFGTYLLTHAAIFWRGAYASGGYPRFLVAIAPLAALSAAAWLDEARGADPRGQRRAWWALAVVAVTAAVAVHGDARRLPAAWDGRAQPAAHAGAAALLGLAALAAGQAVLLRRGLARALAAIGLLVAVAPLGWAARPLRPGPTELDLREAARWLAASPYREARVVAANTWVAHWLGDRPSVTAPERPDFLDDAAPGTVFVWDDGYALVPRYGHTTPERLRALGGWRELWASPVPAGGAPRARVYLHEPGAAGGEAGRARGD